MSNNSGPPGVTYNSSIHSPPPTTKTNNAPDIGQRLLADFGFIVESIIGQVLIAFGGITILGVKPFEALSVLGHNLVDQANAAYIAANSAGDSAATANSRVSTLEARLNASDVPGGTYFTDPFSGASTSSPPSPPYSTTSTDAGAGSYGLDGSGRMTWKGSGSSDHTLTCLNTVTPLATDNGVVSSTFAKKTGGSGAVTYLFARSGPFSAVWAAITDTTVAIQAATSAGVATVATESVTAADGDVWEFWFGTQADATLLWVVLNGATVIAPIAEATHTIGSSSRTCGFGGKAKGVFFAQSPPAELDSLTFADQGT